MTPPTIEHDSSQIRLRTGIVTKLWALLILATTSHSTAQMRGDHPLTVDDSTMAALIDFRATPKFLPDTSIFYPGAPTEENRLEAEAKLNVLIDRLIEGAASNPRKSYVLSEFKLTLAGFDDYDTEERERVCGYMEQIMDIFGIESSDGLLSTWLYGFDPAEYE